MEKEITEIEPRIDNTFSFVNFGDIQLVIDTKTEFFNATNLCNKFGKSYNEWANKDRTKKLFKSLRGIRSNLYIEINALDSNTQETNNLIAGIYLCDELITDLLSWLSPDFYLFCNSLFLNHLKNNENSNFEVIETSKLESQKIHENIEKILENLNQLKKNNEKSMEFLQDIKKSSAAEKIQKETKRFILFRDKYMVSFGRRQIEKP